MKIYVFGPISGMKNLNRLDFELARHVLEKHGHEAVIPHDLVEDIVWLPCPALVWMWSMVRCIDALRTCQAAIGLWGWEQSRGARIEVEELRKWGIPVYTMDEVAKE